MASSNPPAKFTLNLTAKNPHRPSKRATQPQSTLRDSDEEETGAPRHEQVSHFDQSAGGAVGLDAETSGSGPLIIQSKPNRDWRAENSKRKRQRNGLPAEAQHATANGGSLTDKEGDGLGKYGLNVVGKEQGLVDAHDPAVRAQPDRDQGHTMDSRSEQPEQKTEDELALEALLGQRPKPTSIIPVVSGEDEAFRRDFEQVPDVSTYEDYIAVPVEGYGAAILRGMGWKEGEAVCRRRGQQPANPRIRNPRSALLGIGAKEEAVIGLQSGNPSNGKQEKGGRKTNKVYNPVLLRNRKTGELLTEEELKLKVDKQKAGGEDFVFDEKRRISRRRRSQSRDRERDQDRSRDLNRGREGRPPKYRRHEEGTQYKENVPNPARDHRRDPIKDREDRVRDKKSRLGHQEKYSTRDYRSTQRHRSSSPNSEFMSARSRDDHDHDHDYDQRYRRRTDQETREHKAKDSPLRGIELNDRYNHSSRRRR